MLSGPLSCSAMSYPLIYYIIFMYDWESMIGGSNRSLELVFGWFQNNWWNNDWHASKNVELSPSHAWNMLQLHET